MTRRLVAIPATDVSIPGSLVPRADRVIDNGLMSPIGTLRHLAAMQDLVAIGA
jgi:hypothetical protein